MPTGIEELTSVNIGANLEETLRQLEEDSGNE